MRQTSLQEMKLQLHSSWRRIYKYFSSYPRPKPLATFRKTLDSRNYKFIIALLDFSYIIFIVTLLSTAIPPNTIPKFFDIIVFARLVGALILQNMSSIIILLLIPVIFTVLCILLTRIAQKDAIREYAVLRQRSKEQEPPPPPGFRLRHTLRGHTYRVNSLAWSPDGLSLASGASDSSIKLWDIQTAYLLYSLSGHSMRVHDVTWSPDKRNLASISYDDTIRIWNTQTGQLLLTRDNTSFMGDRIAWSPDGHLLASGAAKVIRIWKAETGELLRILKGHSSHVYSLAWSPNGHLLASGSEDRTIRLWNAETGQLLHTLKGHSKSVRSVVWSPDGLTLASGSDDRTIRFWDPGTGRHKRTIEGHTEAVYGLSFSFDSRLLASKSRKGIVRLWRSDTEDMVTVLKEASTESCSLAFHPEKPLLATLSKEDTIIRIWELDIDAIGDTTPNTSLISYTNAKVVLVGDSGVGKSGLGLVLSGKKFTPTDSSHGRRVWMFDHDEVDLGTEHKETREILLWDMAGQPGYRLIHQLHLNDVAVALVVFDARSETDPFAGVQHWNRALSQAQRIQEGSLPALKKFLVSARIDRGSVGVSSERIRSFMDESSFDGYFETSAREGWGINELREAIRLAIDWEALPRVSSTELFQCIKTFLVSEKETGRTLSTIDDLYSTFLKSRDASTETEDLRVQFETCIGRVESAGLIKRLSFGKLVLLQPELLDAYASALINAVKDEPDGLGSILEEKVRMGTFRMPTDEQVRDKEQEKLLLIAMVEDLLRRELALREEAFLIFPSQSTRENPNMPDPEGKAITFTFEGPVLNIYTTLAVRLANSGLFKKKELWKNAITYTTNFGGTCGIFLNSMNEGYGELTVFFEKTTSKETRFNFEDYVWLHLQRKALPESLKRRRIFTCSECGFLITDQLIQIRNERGFNWLDCPGCSKRITLLDREEQLTADLSFHILEMDRAADNQRDIEAAKSAVQGKKETKDFDVFLCHNGIDKPIVKKIGEQLKEHGILPWLDEWELRPGLPWQRLLEEQIKFIKTAAVFVGKNGTGSWQNTELYAFLRQFIKRGCPIIPVILPDCEDTPELPIFLEAITWVDFRKQDPDPLESLIWGILGEHQKE